MYSTDGTNITIPYGDSADLRFEIIDDDTDAALELEQGQKLVFEVYAVNSTQLYMRITAGSDAKQNDDTYIIPVLPSHTKINRNKYRYMLRIANADETIVDTIIGYDDELYLTIG